LKLVCICALVLSPFVFLVGGGIAMCCLYKPGERIDALGYWILAIMVTPYLLMGLSFLIWRPLPEPDEEDFDEE
jgi:hypothetical protein